GENLIENLALVLGFEFVQRINRGDRGLS
ncbi:MAG: hypothetical protein HW380_3322, partial [Magnetococcales bacterium]|nr:hypothetical protein [Magnetococcales bacterium]